MSRAGKKLIAIVIWSGIGVLVGMQLGGLEGTGIQNAPLSGQQVQQVQSQDELPAPQDNQGSKTYPEIAVREESPKFEPVPRDILLPESPKPPADVLADKTAGLLQQLSNQSIRWVVSVFGSITD